MIQTMRKHTEEEVKLEQLKDDLSKVLVIVNSEHLEAILQEIGRDRHMNATKKDTKKRELIKMQFKIQKT